MSADFNKIRVENEKLVMLEDSLGWDKVRQLVQDNKLKAFGGIMNLLSKPKAEEIEVIYEERRFEAFWHVIGKAEFEYKKRNKYHVPVASIVKEVNLLGQDYKVDKSSGFFELEVVDHCSEQYREELMIEAKSDQPRNFTHYLNFPSRTIDSTDELIKDGTPIVNLETRAQTLVRQVLATLVKPIKADEILKEEIVISDLNLYFFPVYTFELFWKNKDKKATISFDGVTTELNLKAVKISDKLKDTFTSEDLFEFSKEIAQNIIPGGGLAVMMGKKVLEMSKKKSA